MIVHRNEPAEAVPEDADQNMHQVVEEMKEKGIVPPRSVFFLLLLHTINYFFVIVHRPHEAIQPL